MKEIKVSIKCLVYNHEPFLRQCLDGFVMQKTSFAFEAIVHDDASTDKSADIIREYADKYPDIIKPIYEVENQYSKNDDSLNRIIMSAMNPSSKYIAFCEGDDYWTDPYKLQKQVDILEKNRKIGLVFSKVKYWDETNHIYLKDFGAATSFEKLLFKGNSISTMSVCLRKEIVFDYNKEIEPSKRNWRMGDYPLWIYASVHYDLFFINEIMCTYRILEESASHSKDMTIVIDFLNSYTDIRLFYSCKYGFKKGKINKILESHIIGLYRIIMDYNGDINILYKKLNDINFFSLKLLILKIALKNKVLNKLLINKIKN